MKISQSILSFLLFAVLIAIPPILLQYTGNTDWLVPRFWLIFLFMTGLTFIGMLIILVVQQKNKDFYVQGFLASTTVKILASIIFIVVFLMKNKVNKYVFLADFFYIYLLNMVFEVYVLLRNLRHKNLR